MCIGCVTSATAQRSITDTTFTVSNVEIVANKKQALQDKPVELLGMDVPLKFLPITVTRLDSKTMERKHITNMEDAVRFLPGVVMSSNQLSAFQRYSVRGTTDAVFAFDGIRDDRTLLNTVPFGDLSSVESIEVIKGPASVLSGYSVMGGVINIIRKKASAEFTANASVSYGSWDQKEATVGMEVTKKGYLEANVSFNDDHYTTDIGGAPVMPGDMFATATGQPFAASGERNPMADYETV